MSDLVVNPEDRFSRVAAHISLLKISKTITIQVLEFTTDIKSSNFAAKFLPSKVSNSTSLKFPARCNHLGSTMAAVEGSRSCWSVLR